MQYFKHIVHVVIFGRGRGAILTILETGGGRDLLQSFTSPLDPGATGQYTLLVSRVAELGSLSSGAKMAMKIFVKRVFTIFAFIRRFCA